MSIPILTTKLYIPPPRPEFIPRPGLIERLNEGRHRTSSVTLISAPAGFGKTTLVSSWLDHLRITNYELRDNTTAETQLVNPKSKIVNHAAWLSLDENDNDPTRFMAYLVAALQTIAPTVGEGALAALQSPQPPPTESILTTLLNDITIIPDKILLVLDDYHVIQTQTIDQALIFLLDHLPPRMQLVIATREDPPLPLARLRVRGQLTELRATDLRFTPAEAAVFLNQVMGLNLTAAEIAALERRTEGWIAGLQLAALSMRGQQDTTGFITSFTGSHRFVMDYLVEEVLHQQSESVQSFLLRTSILDRLCGPLCDAVMGELAIGDWGVAGDDQAADNPQSPMTNLRSQDILEYLERANLLLVPLDDERHWYRYHHLFADVLQARLLKAQPALVANLHRRACDWYEQHDLRPAAIRHALAAEDFERAAALIELAWPEMDGRFQTAAWLGWAKRLPDEVVRVRPVLGVAYGWAHLSSGEMEAGEARLREAERWLASPANQPDRPEAPPTEMVVVDEAQFRSLPASIAMARAYSAQALGDVPGTVRYARQALDRSPEADHYRRGAVAGLLACAYWANGELEAAYQTFADSMANLKRSGNILFAMTATLGLAGIRVAQGRLYEAIGDYQQSIQLARKHGGSIQPVTADMVLGLSGLYREQGEAEAAAHHLLKSKELGEQAALPDWPYRYCLAQAKVKEDQGDLAGALALLDEAARLYFRTPLPTVRPIPALRARVWMKQGRLAEAQSWARERGLSVADALSYLREFEHITLARLLIAAYRRDGDDRAILEAAGFLERLLQAAEAGARTGSIIEILIVQALAHQAHGDVPAALASLERALTLAEPAGYVRIFVDEGPPLAELLSGAAARGVMPDYTAKLLAAFEDGMKEDGTKEDGTKDERRTAKTSPSSPVLSEAEGSEMIEPLSERELEILRLVADGLSNRAISERLFLALSTVKGHNRNIFGKLQVQRRTEAVARARELGLL